MTDRQRLETFDAVFVGRFMSASPTWSSRVTSTRYVFEVERVVKGKVHEVQSVYGLLEPMCGNLVAGGPRTLVYAQVSRGLIGVPLGQLGSGGCSGNRTLIGPWPVGFPDGHPPLAGESPPPGLIASIFTNHTLDTGASRWAWARTRFFLVAAMLGLGVRSIG